MDMDMVMAHGILCITRNYLHENYLGLRYLADRVRVKVKGLECSFSVLGKEGGSY